MAFCFAGDRDGANDMCLDINLGGTQKITFLVQIVEADESAEEPIWIWILYPKASLLAVIQRNITLILLKNVATA